MIKKGLFVLLILSSVFVYAAPTKSTDFQGDIRLFKKQNNWNHMLELTYAKRDIEEDYKHILLGTKYRIATNWKLGVYFQQDYGVWHDSDWLGPRWADVAARGEVSSILEADFRYLLGFSTTTVFSFRTRYLHNFSNDQDTIKIRPSVSIFASRYWSYFVRYEAYIPLNYSSETFYEHWFYLSSSYKLNDHMRVGPFVSYAIKSWEWQGWSQESNSIIFGLSSNFYF